MATEQQQFEAMERWAKVALAHSSAREEYRVKWALEFSSRDSVKPESARKAATDAVTSDLRKLRDSLEIEATKAWQEFLVLRGPTDFSRQPGQKFGSET